jgi:hypothetical protein
MEKGKPENESKKETGNTEPENESKKETGNTVKIKRLF